MSLLWARVAKRDYSAIDSEIDENAHNLPKHAGMRMDSPDLGKDADFDDAFDHAGQCKNKACYPQFKMMNLRDGKVRGNEPDINPEHVKKLMRSPHQSNLPEVIRLRGEHHIVDGHHRILSHMLKGDTHAPVLVHDGDQYLNSPANAHTHNQRAVA